VLELHRNTGLKECGNQRLNARGVVIPAASVHVRAVLQKDRSPAILAGTERVVDVSTRVRFSENLLGKSFRHGLFALFDHVFELPLLRNAQKRTKKKVKKKMFWG
jgi:hypothetical protein